MTSEYVLRIPLERHIINTQRSFNAVIKDIRDDIRSSAVNADSQKPPTDRGLLHECVNGTPTPARLVSLGEFDIDHVPARERDADRLLRLLVDMPAATGELFRSLPDACAYCPVTILVQQIADDGTRLVYDSVASTISVYRDEGPLAVARALDADVLALLRRVAARC